MSLLRSRGRDRKTIDEAVMTRAKGREPRVVRAGTVAGTAGAVVPTVPGTAAVVVPGTVVAVEAAVLGTVVAVEAAIPGTVTEEAVLGTAVEAAAPGTVAAVAPGTGEAEVEVEAPHGEVAVVEAAARCAATSSEVCAHEAIAADTCTTRTVEVEVEVVATAGVAIVIVIMVKGGVAARPLLAIGSLWATCPVMCNRKL